MPTDPVRIGVPRHVPSDIDPAVASHVFDVLQPHLGSAMLQLQRLGWTEQVDADNWRLTALAVAPPLLAVAHYSMRDGSVVPTSVEVYRTVDVRTLHTSPDRVYAQVFAGAELFEIELPPGTLACEVLPTAR